MTFMSTKRKLVLLSITAAFISFSWGMRPIWRYAGASACFVAYAWVSRPRSL